MDAVRILEKPQEVSYEQIQTLLKHAHEANAAKGLLYVTANQSVEELIAKIGNGTCYVAMVRENGEDVLAGTATVCPIRLNYWYYSGDVVLIKLLGVDPKYKGHGISTLLIEQCLAYAREKKVEVVVSDSAEENHILYNLLKKFDFELVDYCKYPQNNFVSAVYAYFLHGHPWDDVQRMEMLQKKRASL